jgi:hypothetical protein
MIQYKITLGFTVSAFQLLLQPMETNEDEASTMCLNHRYFRYSINLFSVEYGVNIECTNVLKQ